MARHRKQSLPGWFPFALVASGFVVVAAGIRSNWKLARELEAERKKPQTQPPIAHAGALQDWFGGGYRI